MEPQQQQDQKIYKQLFADPPDHQAVSGESLNPVEHSHHESPLASDIEPQQLEVPSQQPMYFSPMLAQALEQQETVTDMSGPDAPPLQRSLFRQNVQPPQRRKNTEQSRKALY